jgi:hypothetical protein
MSESIPDEDLPSMSLPRKAPASETEPAAAEAAVQEERS